MAGSCSARYSTVARISIGSNSCDSFKPERRPGAPVRPKNCGISRAGAESRTACAPRSKGQSKFDFAGYVAQARADLSQLARRLDVFSSRVSQAGSSSCRRSVVHAQTVARFLAAPIRNDCKQRAARVALKLSGPIDAGSSASGLLLVVEGFPNSQQRAANGGRDNSARPADRGRCGDSGRQSR